MKQIINLVKKDYLLIKKYMLLIALIAIITAFLILPLIGLTYGIITYFVSTFTTTIYVVSFVHGYLSKIKYKYDGDTFLSITTYSRKQLVIANYLFTFSSFLASICIIFFEFMMIHFYNGQESFKLWFISTTFFVISFIVSLIIPLEYKFGLVNSQLITSFIIVSTPFLLSAILRLIGPNHLLMNLSNPLVSLILFSVGLILDLISINISIKLYCKKDI